MSSKIDYIDVRETGEVYMEGEYEDETACGCHSGCHHYLYLEIDRARAGVLYGHLKAIFDDRALEDES